jgi:DNA-binding CsgD family transcriptional regulator
MTAEVLGRDAELASLAGFLDCLRSEPGALVLADLLEPVFDAVAAERPPPQARALPVERGRTLLVLGGIQRRLKQRGAAGAELGRVSGRPAGSATLSVTRQRVAELVARGLSTREIAAELFVTVRTVESTLTSVYAKLGVRSRTELAVRVRPGGPAARAAAAPATAAPAPIAPAGQRGDGHDGQPRGGHGGQQGGRHAG